jgi:hypothetical protein
MKLINSIKLSYKNISFHYDFIGITSSTTIKDMKYNFASVEKYFPNEQYRYKKSMLNVLFLSLSYYANLIKSNSKFSRDRVKGSFFLNNFKHPTQKGAFMYPEDFKTRSFLQKFYHASKFIPDLEEQKNLFYNIQKNPHKLKNIHMQSDEALFIAKNMEILLFEKMLYDKDYKHYLDKVKVLLKTYNLKNIS